MSNYTTSPNQKTITVCKELCDNQHYYTMINLNALELASIDLKAGAFKLWVYLAKNQNNYTFALSNKAAQQYFGIKKDQYDSAVKELIEKGYLIETSKNKYLFSELKSGEKPLLEVAKTKAKKQENPITNNTDNTINNTKEKTFVF